MLVAAAVSSALASHLDYRWTRAELPVLSIDDAGGRFGATTMHSRS
jgi:hypothetical protein